MNGTISDSENFKNSLTFEKQVRGVSVDWQQKCSVADINNIQCQSNNEIIESYWALKSRTQAWQR